MHQYYVYIMSSQIGMLYIGITNDLIRRVFQHKNKQVEGFTKKHNITRLIYYEETNDVNAALSREKQLKSWNRSKKLALIHKVNSTFQDLSEGWFDAVSKDNGVSVWAGM